ncbi:Metal tolerance protein 8 [Platanthera guangdongensis]|uniref:Metal tolerance protein 8 n=1 Tax=Platanthera guangdongensis TaxID=2320717 RepID=A0ABR2M1G0_9ASPA
MGEPMHLFAIPSGNHPLELFLSITFCSVLDLCSSKSTPSLLRRHYRHGHQLRSSPSRPSTPSFCSSSTAALLPLPPLRPSLPLPLLPFLLFLHPLKVPPPPFLLPSFSSSFPSLLLLLLSLRSLYSLLPFIRSTPPSFSLFPFSFLISLLSFLLSLPPSLPLQLNLTQTRSLLRLLSAKSALLTVIFLLRFQSLRYCSAAASILADFSGALVARSLSQDSRRSRRGRRIIGFIALTLALVLLSYSWDRVGCFPLSSSSPPSEGCDRIAPMLLPFLSGLLGFYERSVGNSGPLRQLGKSKTRLASLALTTVILFFPACISLSMDGGGSVSVVDMWWPLINTVIFGVFLNENFSGDEQISSSGKDFCREFLVIFFCTLVLELVYLPKLSLPGFLICGFLLWISVWELGSSSLLYVELGSSDPSENLYAMVMNPIRHILGEKKTRKIALFLLINTAYMIVEFVAGFMSNSLGLISDACHMLFDCAALAIGLYASYISRLPANNQFNYGRGRFEVLSGYANAVFLVLVGALIVLESMERILDPQQISTNSLLTVSVGGLVVNVVGLVFFHEEHHHAHGGGGSCSHSHSHSHSNSSEQTHSIWHPHSHMHSDNVNDHSSGVVDHHDSCSNSKVHSHSSSCEHSHGSHDHGSCNSDHSHSHPHSHPHQQDDYSDYHIHGGKHNHHSNHHEHGRHCNYEHQNLLIGIKEEGLKMHYHIDHNMEGIFLHVLADTMGSVGVVISTLLIKYKGWLIADPACSIFISAMIIISVVPLLRNSAEILLQRIPRTHERNLKVARDNLMKIDGVCGIRNMHVWSFSNTEIVGTVNIGVSSETDKFLIMKRASILFHEAGVKDITIQVECVRYWKHIVPLISLVWSMDFVYFGFLKAIFGSAVAGASGGSKRHFGTGGGEVGVETERIGAVSFLLRVQTEQTPPFVYPPSGGVCSKRRRRNAEPNGA